MPTKQNKKYVAKSTGRVWDTKEEAIKDNARYLSDVRYRFGVKEDKLSKPKVYTIPFIKNKRLTLSNAGLATGAVISENLLDTIAKYANQANLPIKTALGLATKESTLGNPTDDSSIYKILNKRAAKVFKDLGTRAHINNKGLDIHPVELVNFYKYRDNPYHSAIEYSMMRASNELNPDTNTLQDFRNKVDQYLLKGERYADKKADEYNKTYGDKNILYSAFKYYKDNPNNYNPGQHNYQQLVNKRANEVWGSPEIQNWYKGYRRRLESRGSGTK